MGGVDDHYKIYTYFPHFKTFGNVKLIQTSTGFRILWNVQASYVKDGIISLQ